MLLERILVLTLLATHLAVIMIDDKFIFSSPTNNGGEGAAGGKRLAKVKTQIHTSHMATKIVKKT